MPVDSCGDGVPESLAFDDGGDAVIPVGNGPITIVIEPRSCG
jgi:hypothetical protein